MTHSVSAGHLHFNVINCCKLYMWAAQKRKVKVAHTRLPSVGFWSWSWFLAVSLQVPRVINPAVGCHYFLPGLQLPPQPLRGLLPILLLGEQGHNGCEQFAQHCYTTTSWLRFEPGPSVPESSKLTTRLSSHPWDRSHNGISDWQIRTAIWLKLGFHTIQGFDVMRVEWSDTISAEQFEILFHF